LIAPDQDGVHLESGRIPRKQRKTWRLRRPVVLSVFALRVLQIFEISLRVGMKFDRLAELYEYSSRGTRTSALKRDTPAIWELKSGFTDCL
jgi:hypothetical protein